MDANGPFSDEERRAARPFARRAYVRFVASHVVWVGVMIGLFLTGMSETWASRFETPQPGRWASLVAFWSAVVATSSTLPFHLWHHLDARRLGHSREGWFGWAFRTLVSSALHVVKITFAIWLLWNVAVQGVALLIVVAIVATLIKLVVPFPSFEVGWVRPLEAPILEERIRRMARRARVKLGRIYVNDSPRSPVDDAYVGGFWWTSRLMFSGSILSREAREIDGIVAHELGHLKTRDGLKVSFERLAVLVLTIAIGWWLIEVAVPITSVSPPDQYGSDLFGTGDTTERGFVSLPAASWVPLLLAIWGSTSVLTQPIHMALSRRREAAADLFGVRLTADPLVAAESLRRTYVLWRSDLDPGPIATLFFESHGRPADRIRRILAAPSDELRR
jgi:STE24 endopeptidase